jgi:hypothetical protein
MVMPMPRTTREIVEHAAELAKRFEEFEPMGSGKDAAPLARIHWAVLARATAEQAVVDAVMDARAAGLSWREIGASLGTSGEAARQKYGEPVAGGHSVRPT